MSENDLELKNIIKLLKMEIIKLRKYRYITFFVIGLIAGIFLQSIYSAFVIFPNLPTNYNPPPPPSNNGNTTTTTIPTTTTPPNSQATFVLLPFESDGKKWHAGYDIRNNRYYVKFLVNIAEVRGFSGTCKLQCSVWTDTNHWNTYEMYGGLFEIYMNANQKIMGQEILFEISQALYEADGIDWTTSLVEIIYG